ncbi:hypothetical protein AURDEDRAFT_161716 [Auricularia subglabra TFB-10046 SS5]|nr:hypothetical protein AURDEDRAFT_161716 [Auricularia subglabra TFB-10046 SS5]
MGLAHIDVEGCCATVIADALAAADASRSLSMTIASSNTLSINLVPDGQESARFIAKGVFYSSGRFGLPVRELQALFRAPAQGTFDALTSLSYIPRDHPPGQTYVADDGSVASLHSLLFPGATLPRLHTLCVVCGPREGDSLLDAPVLRRCGVLMASVLHRLVFRCGGHPSRTVDPVCPLDLALFVSHHLAIETSVLAELLIEREVGLYERDDGGAAVEVLKSHVGSLVIS